MIAAEALPVEETGSRWYRENRVAASVYAYHGYGAGIVAEFDPLPGAGAAGQEGPRSIANTLNQGICRGELARE